MLGELYNYDHLLSIANLPTLENRHDVMKLSILYQMLDGSWHFQLGVFLYDHFLRHHSLHDRTLVLPLILLD